MKSLSDWKSVEIQKLIENDKGALIEVIVDSEQSFSPKLASRKLSDGSMVSPSLEDMAPFLSREELGRNMIEEE